MGSEVKVHAAFEEELSGYETSVRVALLAAARLLADYGPQLGRPFADTLNGSKHANMKELRFTAADGEWRAAFAFDPGRQAILLAAGDKSGGSQKLFYRRLAAKADARFSGHLKSLNSAKKKGRKK